MRALAYHKRPDEFGGWHVVIEPPADAAGAKIALQPSDTPPQDHPPKHLDLHGPGRVAADELSPRLRAPAPANQVAVTWMRGAMSRLVPAEVS